MRLRDAIEDFSAHHTTRNNRLCHYLGLPAIAASVLGALAHVPVGPVDAALVLLAVTFVLDVALDWRVALGVAALGAALYLVARTLPLEGLGVLFALGWGAQLVGHRVFEKRAPAFAKNLVHLFVGPRWLVTRLLPRRGGDASE